MSYGGMTFSSIIRKMVRFETLSRFAQSATVRKSVRLFDWLVCPRRGDCGGFVNFFMGLIRQVTTCHHESDTQKRLQPDGFDRGRMNVPANGVIHLPGAQTHRLLERARKVCGGPPALGPSKKLARHLNVPTM